MSLSTFLPHPHQFVTPDLAKNEKLKFELQCKNISFYTGLDIVCAEEKNIVHSYTLPQYECLLN